MNKSAASSVLSQIKTLRAEKELARVRRDADKIRANCKTLVGFVKEAWKVLEPSTPYIHNWHIDAICEHLEAITWGRMTPRLIINISPGSSKSMIVSVLWQAWQWGPCGMPGQKFLTTSYEEGNARRDTRKTRDLIMSDWFQELWPMKLPRTGETSFSNEHTGTREGVAFQAIMGKRGDVFGIDDPHSLDGAESDAERDKATRRFLEGGQNRINDQVKSAIVVIMQRVHQTDLTGVILARDLGYEHLMIPMEFETSRVHVTEIGWKDPRTYEGELMDPRRMPQKEVDKFKTSPYAWAGQYQQRPAPREGGMFKPDEIKIIDHAPKGGRRVRGWDIAGSTRKNSPYTVGLLLNLTEDNRLVIENMRRKRAEIEVAEAMIIETAFDDKTRYQSVMQSLPQDPGSAGKSQKRHLAPKMHTIEFKFTPERGKKEDRAIGIASQVNVGNVSMVAGPWNAELIDELRNFPGSTFKDITDALSRAYDELVQYMDDDEDGIGAPIFIDGGED